MTVAVFYYETLKEHSRREFSWLSPPPPFPGYSLTRHTYAHQQHTHHSVSSPTLGVAMNIKLQRAYSTTPFVKLPRSPLLYLSIAFDLWYALSNRLIFPYLDAATLGTCRHTFIIINFRSRPLRKEMKYERMVLSQLIKSCSEEFLRTVDSEFYLAMARCI